MRPMRYGPDQWSSSLRPLAFVSPGAKTMTREFSLRCRSTTFESYQRLAAAAARRLLWSTISLTRSMWSASMTTGHCCDHDVVMEVERPDPEHGVEWADTRRGVLGGAIRGGHQGHVPDPILRLVAEDLRYDLAYYARSKRRSSASSRRIG